MVYYACNVPYIWCTPITKRMTKAMKPYLQILIALALTFASFSHAAGELVNMITMQRAYQANAQTIKTQDSLMQTLVNLR